MFQERCLVHLDVMDSVFYTAAFRLHLPYYGLFFPLFPLPTAVVGHILLCIDKYCAENREGAPAVRAALFNHMNIAVPHDVRAKFHQKYEPNSELPFTEPEYYAEIANSYRPLDVSVLNTLSDLEDPFSAGELAECGLESKRDIDIFFSYIQLGKEYALNMVSFCARRYGVTYACR